MNHNLNLQRRRLTLAIAALAAPGAMLSLSSCGGGTDAVSGDASTAPVPSANTSPGTETAFTQDPAGRILFLDHDDGHSLHYYGTQDSNGNITDITGATYNSPNNAAISFMMNTVSGGIQLNFDNGDTLALTPTATGNDYAFSLFSSESKETFFSTLSEAKSALASASAATPASGSALTAASKALMVSPAMRAGRLSIKTLESTQVPQSASALAVTAASKAVAEVFQKVVVEVMDGCGQVKTGAVRAKLAVTVEVAKESVSGKLLLPPPVDVPLYYIASDGGFVANVPISVFGLTNLEVVAADVVAHIESQIKGFLSDPESVINAVLTICEFLELPSLALGLAIIAATKRVQFAINAVKAGTKLLEDGKEVFAAVTDLVHLLQGTQDANKFFPIDVSATYVSQGQGSASKTITVNQPGAEVAAISLSFPTATSSAQVRIQSLTLTPPNPVANQGYVANFSVNCLSVAGYNAIASVSGTDGYTDSATIPIAADSVYQLNVPGAATAGIQDTVTVIITDSTGTTVDSRTAHLQFG